MKFAHLAVVAAYTAREVAAHATFQDFWINGVDQGSTCARLPTSNSPVTDVTSGNIRCNANQGVAASKCAVKAGDTVTVEIHQQPNDRSCSNEAIGGAHYGPVNVYLAKVSDSSAAAADSASTGWFKIFADSWSKGATGGDGSTDNWGTKDINTGCGKMSLKIPSDVAAGDYLLRAEALALHSASSTGGAQFYMTCFQLSISGGGSLSPATVLFPGAYKATDPGILFNMYTAISSYANPGPAVISSGTTRIAGSAATVPGSGTGNGSSSSSSSKATTTTQGTTLKTTTTSAQTTTTAGGGGTNCAAKYGQCGGQGWTGATCCVSGSTCTANGAYYSQCL